MVDLSAYESEADFTDKVIAYAKLRGWMVCHFRPGRTERGWRTPLEGHAGAPDLILARRGYVLLVELKSARGKTTDAQNKWGAHLGDAYRLWKPKDWSLIERELR